MIKWVGKTVSLLLVFCLLAVMIPVSVQADTGGNVCEIVETGTGYATLDDALAAVESGQTIKLLDNIDYNKGIKIINKSITFDLNWFTLNVTNMDDTTLDTHEERSGLYVCGDSIVSLAGQGEFNVTGYWYGVFAENDQDTDKSPLVHVTNATGIKRDGVYAQGGAMVYVRGNVTSYGDASGGNRYYGAYVSDSGSTVYINGDVYVYGDFLGGICSYDLSSVVVEGSVIVNGSETVGAIAGYGGNATVYGDISVTGDNCTGVYLVCEEGVSSIVTVMGEIIPVKQEGGSDIAQRYIVYKTPTGELEEEFRSGDFDPNNIHEYFLIFTYDSDSFVLVNTIAGGTGSADDPFLIANATQLASISRGWPRMNEGYHFKQIADIDLGGFWSTGQGWFPIGGESGFLGVYDGNGHTISNLGMSADYGPAGLFGCIEAGSEIRNVTLVDVDIKVENARVIGSLVGRNNGTVLDSYASGKVYGEDECIGGLVGENRGSIINSGFEGEIGAAGAYTGGLVGCNFADYNPDDDYECGIIKNCYAKVTVSAMGDYVGGLVGGNAGRIINSHADILDCVAGFTYVGGLVGNNSNIGEIAESYAEGKVEGFTRAGGLVGRNEGWIRQSYFTGTVTNRGSVDSGNGLYTGGLVGWNSGLIEFSHANAGVEAPEGDYVGGLAGHNTGYVRDSYAWDDVEADDFAGGLIGYNEGDIKNCYALGKVTGKESHNVGPLIGYSDPEAEVWGSFWNVDTSGHSASYYGIKSDTANMKDINTYKKQYGDQDVDWDFASVWDISSDYNNGYPFLWWETEIKPVLRDAACISVDDSSAELSFKSNKPGTYYYLVFESDLVSTPPDAEEIKAQGSDCAAKGTGPAVIGENSISVAGLDPAKSYTAYIIVEDSRGNISNIAQIAFDTLSVDSGPVVVPLSLVIPVGESKTVRIYLGAGESAAESATVTSNDTTVASVSPSVVNTTNQAVTVTGVSAGRTTLTVSFSGGGYTGEDVTVDVTVVDPVSYRVRFFIDDELYDEVTVLENQAVGDGWPANPVKAGYTFAGWFTGQNGTGAEYTRNTIITGDTDLYAKWVSASAGTGGGGGDDGVVIDPPLVPLAPPSSGLQAIYREGADFETRIPAEVENGIVYVESDLPEVIPEVAAVIMPSVPDVGKYAVKLPVSSLSTENARRMLTLKTDIGSVTFMSNMLTGVGGSNGKTAQITIGTVDKKNLPEDVRNKVGDRPLVQLSLSVDGRQVNWYNLKAPVLVSIPYEPSPEELADHERIVAWFVDGNGNVAGVPIGLYDPEKGMMTFITSYFSYYTAGYNKVTFKDVAPGAWYSKAVNFIAAREITVGTGRGNYSPDGKVTRAQFIVMLMRAFEMKPDTNPKDNFADAGNTWYTGYLAAAKRLGISNGVGNNMFAPEKEITRQEMFTLLYNILKTLDRPLQADSGRTLADFADADQVADWAREAVAALVKAGIVNGSNGRIDPLSTATRAEIAQMMQNLVKNLVRAMQEKAWIALQDRKKS